MWLTWHVLLSTLSAPPWSSDGPATSSAFPNSIILKLHFLKGTVLPGKLVKKCQCKYKQAQQERHFCFNNKHSQSRFITKGKMGAMVIILELIYFNQKNYYLQRQSKTLSSTAQNKTIVLLFFFLYTSHKTSMQYVWSSRNRALITGVDKRHEPRYMVYAAFQRKCEAVCISEGSTRQESRTRTEAWVRDSDSKGLRWCWFL